MLAVVIIIIQLTILDFISIFDVTPDLLIILCVWISINEGQFIGTFTGFGIGIFYDLVSFDVIGTNALVKTVIGFISGYFYKVEINKRPTGNYKFLLILLIMSFTHNFIYYFFYLKISEASFFLFFFKYGILSSIYTTVFGLFPMITRLTTKRY